MGRWRLLDWRSIRKTPYPAGEPEGAISMIRVLLFANLQEEAGRSELQIEKESITVAELKDVVAKEYNVPVTEPIMVAINEEYANEEDTIQSGDVVALIPPVSGG